ncbi:MAG TPA: hypothetical protein VLI92_00935 [Candidatus Saccharimonadales bacterium]|nr:hypothetical protein [Candidatus Saccharimonadales bacterium]
MKIKKSFLVFIIIFALYLSNFAYDFNKDTKNNDYRNLMTAADVIPSTFLPYTLIKDHTFALDSISYYLRYFDSNSPTPYFLFTRNGHKYSVYPVFTAIAAVPFYLIPILLNKIPDFKYHENLLKMLAIGRVAAAFYSALACLLIYKILKKLSDNQKEVILFTIFFALGTTMWSISSRGLWQHTLSVPLLAAVIYLLLKYENNKYNPFFVGLFTGFLVLTRLTNLIIAVMVFVYLVLRFRKNIWMFLVATLPSMVFLFIYNFYVFGSPFIEGYEARSNISWSTPLLTGLLGFLFSPARSFLFISPPLILSFVGIYLLFKNKSFGGKYNELLRFLSVGFIGLILLLSKWFAWHGANGFGYRMLTDLLPIAIILTFLIYQKLGKIAKIVVIIFILYSIVIQFDAVMFKKSRCTVKNNYNFNCLTL